MIAVCGERIPRFSIAAARIAQHRSAVRVAGETGRVRILMLVLACLLMGAAPAQVPVGRFQIWLAYKKAPLAFTSGGVTVHVEALPCPSQPVGDACRWDGYNNQAAVTVSAPGVTPVTVRTDNQSEYVRLAVVQFERSDPRRPSSSKANMAAQRAI